MVSPGPLPTRLFSAYIFDLDGTVYLGEQLLPGARSTITNLRELGLPTVFLSNNPTQSRTVYAHKLTRLGLPTSPEEVVNSSGVMLQFLNRELPGGRLFVVGEDPLISELRGGGFRITEDPSKVDAVIASFDRTFEYRKLQIAFDAIRAGARFFATNSDRYCPVPGGGQPDAAAVIAAIEACTDTRVEVVVGKPSRLMAQAVLELVALPAEECLITGDRLETDVAMGLQAGMSSALALTGATPATSLASSQIQPDYVLAGLDDLLRQVPGAPGRRA